MNSNLILKIFVIFLAGFLSANFLNYLIVYGLEMPFSSENNFYDPSPSDFIKEEQIAIYEDRVVISVRGASMSRYAPTGSMKPVLDERSNGIRIKPASEESINIGDIITFRRDNQLIVHRVIEKGWDNEGVYFITRGDNNSVSDKKVKFEDIEYITIAIIW
jgi:hypothetical protein